jgi:hypothetical protein
LKFKASPGEEFKDAISSNVWVWWRVLVIPTMLGSTNRRIMIQANLGTKWHSISKITNTQKWLVEWLKW